jgi:hypothetical protein
MPREGIESKPLECKMSKYFPRPTSVSQERRLKSVLLPTNSSILAVGVTKASTLLAAVAVAVIVVVGRASGETEEEEKEVDPLDPPPPSCSEELASTTRALCCSACLCLLTINSAR